jgi:hypothetical protein
MKMEVKAVEECTIEEDIKGEEEDSGVKKRKKMKSIDPKDMTEEQLVERRYECLNLVVSIVSFLSYLV